MLENCRFSNLKRQKLFFPRENKLICTFRIIDIHIPYFAALHILETTLVSGPEFSDNVR